jgi:ABC-type nitrate/sulfonate/bicarbonate transport system substrate-binding protein
MKIPTLLPLGALLFGFTAFDSASLNAQQGKLEEGIMAVPVVGLAFSLGYLADDLNLWEKHGVKMKTVEISGIGAMNSVISGSTDFTQSSGSAITRAAARGQRLVAIVATIDKPSVQVVLRKDLATAAGFDPKAPLEKRALALRGRTIAVDAINSIIHAYVRFIAKRAGFDPEEIRIAVLQPPNMLAALQAKQIDGFAMAPPWVQKPVIDGDATMIVSGPDGDPADLTPFTNTAVATKPETCVKRKALCEGVGQTFREAVGIMLDRPNDALALLKKRFAQLDERQLRAAFEDIRKITPRSLIVSKAGLENAERFNVEAGLLKPEEKLTSYDDLFTDQFVR